MTEGGAEHIGIALLGDGGRFTTGEVGDLTALALGHRDHDGAGIDRAKNGEHIVVHGFLGQTLGHARVGLGVFRGEGDSLAQNATGGIDFLDGQFHAILEQGTCRGAGTRHFNDVGNLDAVLGLSQAGRDSQGAHSGEFQSKTFLHKCLLKGSMKPMNAHRARLQFVR